MPVDLHEVRGLGHEAAGWLQRSKHADQLAATRAAWVIADVPLIVALPRTASPS